MNSQHPLPDCGRTVQPRASAVYFLHSGLRPQTVTQDSPSLPSVALLRHFVTAIRKITSCLFSQIPQGTRKWVTLSES